jgi:ABC-type multidrug transport system ATPase subunit
VFLSILLLLCVFVECPPASSARRNRRFFVVGQAARRVFSSVALQHNTDNRAEQTAEAGQADINLGRGNTSKNRSSSCRSLPAMSSGVELAAHEVPEITRAHGAQDAEQPGAECKIRDEATKPVPTGGASYLSYLTRLSSAWPDCPSVEVAFQGLSCAVRNDQTIADAQTRARVARKQTTEENEEESAVILSKADENIPNLAKATWGIAKAPIDMVAGIYRSVARKVNQEEVLQTVYPCSGVIKPGRMTLVIGAPGAGKSQLLQALSGRLPLSQNSSVGNGQAGVITYNGLSRAELAAKGIPLTRLCAYVGQSETAFPTLSVTETLEFGKQNACADIKLLRESGNIDTELEQSDARRTELLLDMMGLSECKNTPIGNDLLRGVSGGQKKRVQLAEALLTNARIYALDEVSTGLDSAVTLHLFSQLKAACESTGMTVITALQQPTPETYALFSDLILMREGRVVYHGPRSGVTNWMRAAMEVPFVPSQLEEAGFLLDLLSDPKTALEKARIAHHHAQKTEREQQHAKASAAAAAAVTAADEVSNSSSSSPPLRRTPTVRVKRTFPRPQ